MCKRWIYRLLPGLLAMGFSSLLALPATGSEPTGLDTRLEREVALGKQALRSEAPEQAVEIFRKLLLDFPASVEARMGLAEGQVAQQKPREAHGGLVQASQRAFERGDYPAALELLSMAVDVASHSAETSTGSAVGPLEARDTFAQAGRAALLNEQHLRASRWLEAAVAEAPGPTPVPSDDLPRGVASRSGQPWTTWLYLGAAKWELGQLEEAESASRRAAELSQGNPLAVHQLGRLLLWSARFSPAESVLQQVDSATAPTDFVLDLARSQEGQGRLEQARETFLRAVDMAPESSRARWGLAQVLLRLGERELAREHLSVYQQLYEQDQSETRQAGLEEAARDRASRYLAQAEGELALDALPSPPWSVETSLVASGIFQVLGEQDKAIDVLMAAVSQYPDRSDLRVRLQELRLQALASEGAE